MIEKKYSFDVETESADGTKLKGVFHMRRATLLDLGAISAGLSRANEGQPFVSSGYEALLTLIIAIEVCGESVPDWWERVSSDPVDTRVVMNVGGRLAGARDKHAPFQTEPAKEETNQQAVG